MELHYPTRSKQPTYGQLSQYWALDYTKYDI